jgi:hypothetical protein
MDMIGTALRRLGEQLPGDLSMPGSDRYAAATAIWAKPVGPMPRAVVHCRTAMDVQSAIRVARDSDLPLSVRGGGHDWAGRALCGGLVIDLSAMNGTVVAADHRSARIAGPRLISNGQREQSSPTVSVKRPAYSWPVRIGRNAPSPIS